MRHAPLAALLAALTLTLAVGPAAAQTADRLPDYADGMEWLPQSPSVTAGAPAAFANPAAWAAAGRAEFALWWNDRHLRRTGLDNWGLSFGRHVGFALDSRVLPVPGGTTRLTDWQVGVARGDRRAHAGLAYRWSSGDDDGLRHDQALALGLIGRPGRAVSWGLAGAASLESAARQATADLGVRPFGTPALTLFGDYTLRHGEDPADGRWGIGMEFRPLPGLHLGARVRETDDTDDFRFTLVAGMTLGGTAYHALPAYDRGGHATGTAFLVRAAAPHRSLVVPDALRPDRRPRWAAINLEHRILTYQKYRWFDDSRVAWLDLARRLDRLRDAPDIDGVAFNLAGLRPRPSLAWELRRKLGELRAAGKEVVVHADNLGMLDTWLATAGDRLTLDPQGSVTLPGFAARRTYVRGSLAKLGVGFQELRFMPCKSAVEVFARDEMSECEREQRQRLIDVAYETVRDGVCASRRLAPAAFDSLVDTRVMLSPVAARDAGLADGLGRWSDVETWVKQERHGRWTTPSAPPPEQLPDERWGRPDEVAVVFAVGECAMDSGIRGRATSAHLRRLVHDRRVKAVVLRADSPGGDPQPSDLIAEAVAKLVAAGKPVVISQGDVAASGGYWISLGGSRLLTTPFTVTGSIGVISGWFWDDGLGDKLGMRADGVQRGVHADLFAGLRPPLLGLSIPTRPLDDSELALVKGYILGMYDQFVGKVAAARGLPEARVRELGGGRVWMGDDAIARGLCDAQGGLSDAIALARDLAGIRPGDEVVLSEFPARRLVELPKLGPSLPGLSTGVACLARVLGGGGAPDAVAANAAAAAILPGPADLYLQGITAQPGRPLLLTPPDGLPEPWLGPW